MDGFSFQSWFKGIKGRLLFAAVLPVIGFSILGAISYQGVSRIVLLLDEANSTIIPTFDVLAEMRQARNKYSYQMWQAIATDNAEFRKEKAKIARETVEEFIAAEKYYEKTPMEKEELDHYNAIKPRLIEYYANTEKAAALLESNDPQKLQEAVLLLNGPITKAENDIRAWNDELTKIYRGFAADGLKAAGNEQKTVNNMVILVTLCSAFAIFGILLWIAAKVSNSVGAISGKLTVAGGQVASAVEQLNEAGNSLSQSSTEAAASLEETVAALEEMTSMVQMNSDNAKQAAALSASSREAAERGEHEIQSLIQSMTSISQSSKKIEEIISVIDDIAFQTNLLALNAAVEAARAGEQGKGFAVVAEAVRALAQRSASAAKDITSLIKDSVAQIEGGSKIADQSGAVLSNITNSVKKVSDLNTEIAAASSEQTTGIQQISKAMNQLDQASQSNAASAEEIAATSGEINNLAAATQQLTVELNAMILGSDMASSTHHEERHEAKKAPAAKTGPKKFQAQTNNVVKFKPAAKQSAPKVSAQAIPFDEDEQRAKVGTTDGF
ncbi:Methyl-accepting chemotaxis protein I [compost metagenome]